MKKIYLLFTSLFLLFLISCSNIVSGLNDTNIEEIKKGSTEIQMFVPDYQLYADSKDARVIAPQTKSVRLSYKQHTYDQDKWFTVSTISLEESSKVETVTSAPNNFPGKVYTFTFNGLELGDYNIGDLKIDLLDSFGTVVTSGFNNTPISVLADNKASTQFFTIPLETNGNQGSLKAGEMKFISLAVLKGIEYTFNITTNGDYPDVVLFSQNGKFENYFVNDSIDSSLIKFTSNATEMKYLGIWADNGNDISSYKISFNNDGGTILESAVLSGNDLHWTKQNSPYYINQNTLVKNGTQLIIDAGVQVFVTGSYYLKVEGGIQANGTKAEPIIFMKSIDNMGSWNGITLNSDVPLSTNGSYIYSSGNIFNHCTFVNATTPLTTDSAIYVSNCIFTNNSECPELPHSIVVNNKLYEGISGVVNATIINNDIYKYHKCGGLIRNNTFYNCQISCRNYHDTVIKYNTFNNCSFSAFDYEYRNYDINFNNFEKCKSPIFTTTEAHSNDTINVKNNYWGDTFTNELKANRATKTDNLSFIHDYYDDFELMEFDYSGWFEKPIELCGNLGDKLILFDFFINGSNSDIPETKDSSLNITIKPQFASNEISNFRITQSMGDLEKAEWKPYINSFTYVIDRNKNIDGFANIYIQLKDSLGNISTVSSNKLPFDIPSIEFNIQDNQKINKDYFDCEITVKENGEIYQSDIEISIDDVSYGSLESNNIFTLPIKHLSKGEHILIVTATDRVGNIGTKQVTFSVDRQDNNSYEGKSFDITTGEFIKDTNTSYLWHFNNDGSEVDDKSAHLTSCRINTGSGLNNGYVSSAYINSDDKDNTINPILDNSFSVEFWTCNNSYSMTVQKPNSLYCYHNTYSYYGTPANCIIKSYYKEASDNSIQYLSLEKNISYDNSLNYHYWAYVYDGDSFAIYCDGKLMAYKKDITQKLNTNDDKLKINLEYIDELRISKNARSPEEIAAYFNVAKTKFDTQ